MSYAWEVTLEDINTVLERYDITSKTILNKALKKIISQTNRIEKAILYYTYFEEQCSAALSEIEDILIEENIIPDGSKFFDFR